MNEFADGARERGRAEGAAKELGQIALTLAHEAGAHVLGLIDGRGSLAALREGARRKSSATDLVSDADRASESLIVTQLATQRPGDGIVAEEGSSKDSATGISWIIDPIDGTTNFLYGQGSFAISIAAECAGEILAGVVYDPLREETFFATRGDGARCNSEELTAPREATPLAEVLLGTGFHYIATRRKRQAESLVTILPKVRDIRRQGAASLDLCSVAAGRLDAYYEAELKQWDCAAGLLVAHEAGFVSMEIDLGAELENTLLVAHPALIGTLCDLLLESVARSEPQRPAGERLY